MVKTNPSTNMHTMIYTMNSLSHRTGTTRFSAEGGRLPNRRCQVLLTIRSGLAFNLTITHQMAPPKHASAYCVATHLSTRKDERLSWPSWLTCSRRFTHIVVTRQAAGRAQDRVSLPAKDRRSANCATQPTNQLIQQVRLRQPDDHSNISSTTSHVSLFCAMG